MSISAATTIYFVTVRLSIPAVFAATLLICAGGSGLLALQPSTLPVKMVEGPLTLFAALAGLVLLGVGITFMLQGNRRWYLLRSDVPRPHNHVVVLVSRRRVRGGRFGHAISLDVGTPTIIICSVN